MEGDGVTDDTAAIQNAIASGGRCGQGCASSSTTPALVYFPSGTYMISNSIVDYYNTMLIGNPNDLPTLKATAGFNNNNGGWMIDGDPYYTANLNWVSTNVFLRQVRNFNIDMTNVAANKNMAGIHWPTAQATSLQNIVFQMSAASGTQHVGIFIESGSAGFISDLIFNGGLVGANVGNQQFTMRNLTFNNAVTAINQLWDWSFTYKSISINNCQIGIDLSAGGSSAQNVGSILFVDSSISNTGIGVKTAYTSSSQPATAGSLILENVVLNNVQTAVQNNGATALNGGSTTIAGWGQGHRYTPNGPSSFSGTITPNSRPAGLLSGNKYYERSKPQYNGLPVSSFKSARSAGAKGDGNTDDTTALQNVINSAASAGQVVFIDAGTYKITKTITIPPGAKIVGEAFPVLMSSGSFFNDMNNPQPVIKVGSSSGQAGQVEWSDCLVSTQGAQAGAILIEWNLAAPGGSPSGMWDVHTRVGGFAGSNLQVAQCAKTPGNGNVNTNCIAAFQLMHVTSGATNLYLENNWLWTADHDFDSSDNSQITIYSGRGLSIESTNGNIWLSGTGVEHNVYYQYQLAHTKNIYMGFIQTETPYYQPTPNALQPFTPVASRYDPDFASSCSGQSGNCAAAWGLRILDSSAVYVYGAGLYSFFNDYDTTCSNQGGSENCQQNIFSIESSSDVHVYNLATIGAQNMITEDGNSLAKYSDNINVFPEVIAQFNT